MNRVARPESRAGLATVVCLACRVDFDTFGDRTEAAYFAGVHNDLHHGCGPVAFPVPVDLEPAQADPLTPFGGDAA